MAGEGVGRAKARSFDFEWRGIRISHRDARGVVMTVRRTRVDRLRVDSLGNG